MKPNKYIRTNQVGVYFLLDNGVVVYIGFTHKFPNRLMSHFDKRYDSIRLIKTDRPEFYEKRLIKIFQPKYNIRFRGISEKILKERVGHNLDWASCRFKNGY